MQKPSWFSTNLTLGNVLVLTSMLVGGVFGYSRIENTAANAATTLAKFEATTTLRLEKIETATAGLPNLSYRVTKNEEQINATNDRFDASLQTLSARLAEMNQALGALNTNMAVLSQRLEMSAPPRPTR